MNAVRNRLNLWSPRFQHVVFKREAVPSRRPFAGEAALDDSAEEDASHDQGSLVRAILSHAKLSPALYRTDTLRRRIPAVLRTLGAPTVEEARRKLREKRESHEPALSTLLLGVTSFFRDDSVFQALATRILPDVARDRPFIRIWSIGCSDGAEVISIAILLSELGLQKRAYILGMDVRPDAIEEARSGFVSHSAMAHVPQAFRDKYFLPPGEPHGRWRINPATLPAIGWWAHDAMSVKRAGMWDMILCRNMIMYLAPAAAMNLWGFVLKSTRPGGIIVTGRAERPHGTVQVKCIGPCLFQIGGNR